MKKGARPGPDPLRRFLDPLRRAAGASTSVVADLPESGSASGGLEPVRGHLARPAILDQLEADLLPFLEVADAGALESADMDENVLAAIIRLNEAETLLSVEPFNGARAHDEPFLWI